MSLILCIGLTVLCAGAFFPLIEYDLHKKIMHKPIKAFGLIPFDYPFRTHAQIHHHVFRADESYHLKNESDKWTIPMRWWNGPILLLITTAPVFELKLILGFSWLIPISFAAVGILYYSAYEYLHWCMHLPKARRLEFSNLFRRLNGHHLLHHRYMGKNYNVVFPLWDWIFGTLLLRSKIPFRQATGPSVPDVQPRT